MFEKISSNLGKLQRIFGRTKPAPEVQARSTNLAELSQAFLTGRDIISDGNRIQTAFSTHSATYACMSIVAQASSAVPWKLWKDRPDEAGRPIEVYNHPLLDLFADPFPGIYADFCQFVETIVLYLESTGNAWIMPDLPNSRGIPRSLMVLGSQHVTPQYEEKTGRFLYWNVKLGKESIRVPAEDLIHMKYTNPESMNQVLGIGPLQAATRSIIADMARQKYDEKFFVNGSSPSLKLTYTPPETRPNDIFLTPEQVMQIRQTIEDQWAGARNAHKVAIVHGGMQLEELGLSQKEMDFIEGRKWSRQEIASVFRIPVPLLNDFQFAGLGREGVAVAQRMLYENNIVPKLNRLSSVLQKTLVAKYAPGHVGGFDIDEIAAMREDMGEKATIALQFFEMGWPINQINKVMDLGFEPVPWGDDFLVAMNLVPARTIAGPEANLALVMGLDDPLDSAMQIDNATDEETFQIAQEKKDEEKQAEKDKQKQLEKKSLAPVLLNKRSASRDKQARQFEAMLSPLQEEFFRRLHRFFYDLRTEMLKNITKTVRGHKRMYIDELLDGIMFDVPRAQRTIETFAKKHYARAIEAGLTSAAMTLSEDPIGVDGHKSVSLLNTRVSQIRNVPVKLEVKVRELIKTSLMDSHLEGVGIQAQATALREATQEVMTLTAARARRIARTEMLSVVNEARAIEYEEQGIEKISWLSSGDDLVRAGHDLDGEVINVGETFSNGARFPGDPLLSAEMAINCRCCTFPVAEDDE